MNIRYSNFSILVGVILAHAGAVVLLSAVQQDQERIQPPSVASMEMITIANAPKAVTPPAPPTPKPKPKPAPVKPKPVVKTHPTPKSITVPTKPIEEARHDEKPAAPAAAVAAAPAQKTEAPPQPTITEPLSHGGYLNNSQPTYPAMSVELGETGTVRLTVLVTAQGLPANVSLAKSSGYPRLDRAALEAVKTWKFIPAKRGNEPIPYTFIVPVKFSLK